MYRHSSRHTGGLTLTARPSARLRLVASGLVLLAMLACMPKARAIDTCVMSGDNQPTTVAHVVGAYEKDSQNHDFLTDWIHISHTDAWTCTRRNMPPTSTQEVILKAYMPGLSPAPYVFNFGGEVYHVYRSAQTATNSRIGFIMTRRYRIQAASGYDWESPWLPARTDTTEGTHPPVYSHMLTLPNNDTYTISFEYKIRLLKRPLNNLPVNEFPRVGEAIEFQAVEWWFYRANGGSLPMRWTRVRTWFNRTDTTCTTPPSDQIVRLAGVETAVFKGPGSVAGTVGFNLDLFNCTGVSSIEYKLAPVRIQGPPSYHPMALEITPWPLTPEQGTLPLSPASTATGVRVQVLDETGTPVRFDRTSMLKALTYTPGDTSASIPLRARYLQTGPTVTPGTVYATMSVLYMYK